MTPKKPDKLQLLIMLSKQEGMYMGKAEKMTGMSRQNIYDWSKRHGIRWKTYSQVKKALRSQNFDK